MTQLDASALPILSGMSIKRIILEPGAIREPQWNANANQLAYCISGTVLVATLGSADSFSSFIVRPGQMYHVESGAVYHIENIADSRAEIILALRTEHPQHFSLNSSFSAMTDAVLGNTYDLPAAAFTAYHRSPASQIVHRDGPPEIPSTAGLPNARLFDAEGQHAPLSYAYGQAKLARKQYWAALEDLSMYSLQIKQNGMREPHWHPITAEMGYVAKGHARMRVLDPDGALDRIHPEPRRRLLRPPRLPAPHRGHRPRRHQLPDLLRPAHPRRHRLPRHRQRVLPRSPGRRLRHPRTRPPPVPVHPHRPADRRPAQPGRPGDMNAAITIMTGHAQPGGALPPHPGPPA